MDNPEKKYEEQYRLHAIIHGIVQGVGFRYFVLECAVPLNLLGWVRNTYDGCVEITAEGNHNSLSAFLAELNEGPPSSDVTGVNVNWSKATGEFIDFHIRSSGGYGEG